MTQRIQMRARPMRIRPGQTLLPDAMVLCTLHYFGNCAFQRDIADLFGVVQGSISRVLRKTVPAIAELLPQEIHMPTHETDLRKQQRIFFEKGGIPGAYISILA